MSATSGNTTELAGWDRSDRAGFETRVRFTLRGAHGAEQAYVCLARGDGTARAVEPMTGGGRGEWRLELALEPGRYRYRFYVVEGGRTFYYSPADAGCPRPTMDGLDALIEVPAAGRGVSAA